MPFNAALVSSLQGVLIWELFLFGSDAGLQPAGWQRARTPLPFSFQEARMDDQTRAMLADIYRVLAEIERKIATLADQLGVELD